MPTYNLEINVNGHDNQATTVITNLTGGIGTLNVAMGTLLADGVKTLAGGLWDLAKTGTSVAIDYQSSLNMFQAVTGASGDEMRRVGDMAKQLGADMTLPATSAGDAGKAMTELAKAGLSVNESMAAAKGVLQLSAAGVDDNARAAEIAANALMSFGLEGNKATMVADLFAAAANKSSVEVTDVADSFKMSSAVFSSFQGPVVGAQEAMTQLTTAIALLGNVGIKGSDAGTSLKQMLLQLTGPSQKAKEEMQGLMAAAMGYAGSQADLDKILMGKASERAEALQAFQKAGFDAKNMGDIAYDAAGKMRPLPEIINLVSMATKNMSDEQRNAALTSIFGADATRAVIALMRAGPDAFKGMETAITQQGAAADLAGARMKGLGGAVEGFKSNLETTLLTLTEPMLGPLEGGVRAAAEALNNATPALLGFVNTAVVPAVTSISTLAQAFLSAPDKLQFFTGMLGQLGTHAETTLLAALPGLEAAAGGWLDVAVGWAKDAAPRAIGYLLELRDQAVSSLLGALPGIESAAGGWLDAAVGWAKDAAPRAIGYLFDLRNQAIGFVLSSAPGWIDSLRTWSLALLGWIADAAPGMLRLFGEKTGELIGLVGQYAPAVVTALGDWALALAQWVVDAAPGLLRNLGGTVGRLLDAVGGALPGIVEALGHWGAKLVEWVIDAAPGLLRELGSMSAGVLGWIGERVPAIATQLGDWVAAFVTWVGPMIPKLIIELGHLAGELFTWLVQQAPMIGEKLDDWSAQFSHWAATKGRTALGGALVAIGEGLWGEIASKWDAAWAPGSIGEAMLNGIKNGISSNWGAFKSWFMDQVKNIFTGGSEPTGGSSGGSWGNTPARAMGGPVGRGTTYLVGERGPELFTAPSDGGIASASATRSLFAGIQPGDFAGGGSTQIINVTVQGSVMSERDLVESLRAQLYRTNARNAYA